MNRFATPRVAAHVDALQELLGEARTLLRSHPDALDAVDRIGRFQISRLRRNSEDYEASPAPLSESFTTPVNHLVTTALFDLLVNEGWLVRRAAGCYQLAVGNTLVDQKAVTRG